MPDVKWVKKEVCIHNLLICYDLLMNGIMEMSEYTHKGGVRRRGESYIILLKVVRFRRESTFLGSKMLYFA